MGGLDDEQRENSAIEMSGAEHIQINEIPNGENRDIQLSLVSLKSGVQTICDLKLFDADTQSYLGSVHSHTIFVSPFSKTATEIN